MKKTFIEIGGHLINFANVTFIEIKGNSCIFHFVGGEYMNLGISHESLKHHMNSLQ